MKVLVSMPTITLQTAQYYPTGRAFPRSCTAKPFRFLCVRFSFKIGNCFWTLHKTHYTTEGITGIVTHVILWLIMTSLFTVSPRILIHSILHTN